MVGILRGTLGGPHHLQRDRGVGTPSDRHYCFGSWEKKMSSSFRAGRSNFRLHERRRRFEIGPCVHKYRDWATPFGGTHVILLGWTVGQAQRTSVYSCLT